MPLTHTTQNWEENDIDVDSFMSLDLTASSFISTSPPQNQSVQPYLIPDTCQRSDQFRRIFTLHKHSLANPKRGAERVKWGGENNG